MDKLSQWPGRREKVWSCGGHRLASAVKTNKVDKEEELTMRMRGRTPSAAGALLGQRLESASEGDAH